MKKKIFRKLFLWSGAIFLFLVLVLAVHIYIVTRTKTDEHTRIMVRIDIKQPISTVESGKITTWLYDQPGVDHVLCNPKTEMVAFTFSPLKNDADKIADNFRSELQYPYSKRYVPTEKEMQSSCPVASSSFTYKVYKFFKNIF